MWKWALYDIRRSDDYCPPLGLDPYYLGDR
jgi:hypothetical protein